MVPLTAAEADALRAGAEVDAGAISKLGRGRRHLRVDWPTGESAPAASWATGEIAFVRDG